MKYCEEFAALLDPYVDGELSGEEAARVRAHLESCPGCRSYVDGALAIRAAFPEAEETVVPEGFTEGVMTAVRAEVKRARPARKNRNWGRVLLPLAACFALAVLVRTIPGSGGGAMAPAADNTAAPAAMDAAAPAGGGQYGLDGADLREKTADDIPAEADAGAVPELRIAAEPPTSPDPSAPAGALPDGAALQAETGMTVMTNTFGAVESGYGESCRAVRLTADQAGELLADLPYITGEDGVRCYQLPGGDFDALLSALAERDIVPVEEEVPDTERPAEGYDLVYVTEK